MEQLVGQCDDDHDDHAGVSQQCDWPTRYLVAQMECHQEALAQTYYEHDLHASLNETNCACYSPVYK